MKNSEISIENASLHYIRTLTRIEGAFDVIFVEAGGSRTRGSVQIAETRRTSPGVVKVKVKESQLALITILSFYVLLTRADSGVR